MSQQIDLKALERKAWLSTFQDGLIDLFLAALMLTGAVSSWLHLSGTADLVRIPVYMSILALAGGALMLAKRHITIPRIGRATFSPRRQQMHKSIILITMILVTLTIITWIVFTTSRQNPDVTRPIPLGSIVIIAATLFFFTITAHLYELRRLYLYGLLMALPEIVVHLTGDGTLNSSFALTETVVGLIIAVIGGVMLIRFIQNNPVPEIETESTSQSRP